MRTTLVLAAAVLALGWAAPTSAQMCGGPTSNTGATASASGGGGCPMMRSASTGSGQSTEGQRRTRCPMMAMMQGGGMGGMQMQSPSKPSTPATPPQGPGMSEPPTPRP